MLRVILTTGGTGGHVFPALAVAEELKKQVKDVEILFLGGRYGLEQHWVREAGRRDQEIRRRRQRWGRSKSSRGSAGGSASRNA